MEKVFQLLNQMVRDGEIHNYAIGGAIGLLLCHLSPEGKQHNKTKARDLGPRLLLLGNYFPLVY
jgi:hypothetical protein